LCLFFIVVLVLAADVTVVIANDGLATVVVLGAGGRDRQLQAKLITAHAKPLFGAPLQDNPRSLRLLAAGTAASYLRFGVAVGSANSNARPICLGLNSWHTVLALEEDQSVVIVISAENLASCTL
jgi:hypothetical protein